MASFGEALVSSFTATYGTMARAGLQAEQAAYLRNQREGTERFQQEDATLRQQFGIEGAPQAPAAPPATGNVQQAAQPQPAPQAAPAAQPQVPAQAPAQSAVGNAQAAQPAREPPLTQEQLNQISQSGDAVTQAAAARIISPQPQGAPGEMGDTRGPAALANEVATSSGARGRPLTRADWNGYYEARIQSAQANLPPDQAIRMVSMLDGLRQRGFSQSISLAAAAAAAGDAQGATRALTAASNFLPDGFRDDFRVTANGQAIELTRTPEEGGGTPTRTVIPLNQVERYATTLLDPKWALTHYLNVRTQNERERSNRVGEGQRAEELKLRRDDRDERRELELNSGAAIESARTVANAEVAYSRALQSGDQEAITKASEALTTAEQKDAELVGRGLNTRGATGRNAVVATVRSAAQRQESIQLRAERNKALTEIARESLAATVANRDEVNARGRARLAQFDRRLDQHAAALEFRLDVETAKRERDSARDDESKRVANEKLRIAEERLNLYSREVNRRAQPREEITPALRAEVSRAIESIKTGENFQAANNELLGGDASGAFAPMLARNPNFPAENVVRFTNDLFRNPRSFSFGPDFSFAQNSAGTRMTLPTTLQDRVRSLTQSPGGGEGAPGDRPATQDTGSMQRGAVNRVISSGSSRILTDLSDRELKSIVAPYARAGVTEVPANVREAREILRTRELERTRPNPPSARSRSNVSGE
jgi:hypothetical protein